MTVDVMTETLIRRPSDVVAGYVADPDNAPEWYANIESVEWKTPPPLAVGSRIAFVAQFLGRRLSYTYEVAEYTPGERLVMRTAEGPFPMETSYLWEATAEGHTRMTLRNRGTPAGFSSLAAPFMSASMRRANKKDSGAPEGAAGGARAGCGGALGLPERPEQKGQRQREDGGREHPPARPVVPSRPSPERHRDAAERRDRGSGRDRERQQSALGAADHGERREVQRHERQRRDRGQRDVAQEQAQLVRSRRHGSLIGRKRATLKPHGCTSSARAVRESFVR